MSALADWMAAKAPDEGVQWLADKLDVPYMTAYRVLRGHRLPQPDVMRRIARVTRYQVTANDFYGIKPPANRAA